MSHHTLEGRQGELTRIANVIAAARDGCGGVLTITGDAGIGKSALLRAIAPDGFRLLEASGVQGASSLPFVGLEQLLRPIVAAVDRLPTRLRDAIRSALDSGEREVVDAALVWLAVLALLSEVAEQAPLLIVLDDAQWLDPATVATLEFVARRVGGERIALVVAQRVGGRAGFGDGRFDELRLAALERGSALALAVRHAGPDVAMPALERIVDLSAGNPLVVVEVATAVRASAVPDGIVSRSNQMQTIVERMFGVRVAHLSRCAQRSALLAAIVEQEDFAVLVAALRDVGGDPTGWEEAEAAGVISVGPGIVGFRHPLLRAAVEGSASAAEKRASHAALARALAARGHSASAAWHRAAAAVAPDEAVAAALEDAAADFIRRGGYEAAARALERAARLSPEVAPRARRLLGAARAAERAGRAAWAVELAEEVLEIDATTGLTERADLLRASLEAWQGGGPAAYERYVRRTGRADATWMRCASGA